MKQLSIHPLRGSIFENFIISETLKSKHHRGEDGGFYFWRDQKGHEIDLIEEHACSLYPIEIKMSETFHRGFIRNIEYLNNLQREDLSANEIEGTLVYSGHYESAYKNIQIVNWLNYLTRRDG